MLDLDFIVTFAVMGLLFIRQVIIFKQPNKINYAPLLLGIGAIGSMVHLLLNPENENFLYLFRESILPLFVGLMLFIIMNILHQTKQRQLTQTQQEFTTALINQVTQMKGYIAKMESNQATMEANQHRLSEQENSTQTEMQKIFKAELQQLEAIQENQKGFVSKIEAILSHQEEALKNFENFTKKEMPNLDDVVHSHIDMLRIAEQDHFNQVKKALQGTSQSRDDLTKEMAALRNSVERMGLAYKEAAQQMVSHASIELEKLLADFSHRLNALRAQSESIGTSLTENENILGGVREQSELVMKQMILSAKQMDVVMESSERARELSIPMNDLIDEIARIHSDYVAAKVRLETLTKSLKGIEEVQIEAMREQIELLGKQLDGKIENSLNKLHEHYHIAQKDISQTVKELSSRAKMQQSYKVD